MMENDQGCSNADYELEINKLNTECGHLQADAKESHSFNECNVCGFVWDSRHGEECASCECDELREAAQKACDVVTGDKPYLQWQLQAMEILSAAINKAEEEHE